MPKESQLYQTILTEFHSTPLGGHSGIKATLSQISAIFYWPGMHAEIKTYVNKCATCQYNKYTTHAPNGLLQPLPTPEHVWEDIRWTLSLTCLTLPTKL